MQQLSALSGDDRHRGNGLERHRQGIASANEAGRYRDDTERCRETAGQCYDNHYAGILHDVAVGQRGKYRAKGRLSHERLGAILDTA